MVVSRGLDMFKNGPSITTAIMLKARNKISGSKIYHFQKTLVPWFEWPYINHYHHIAVQLVGQRVRNSVYCGVNSLG